MRRFQSLLVLTVLLCLVLGSAGWAAKEEFPRLYEREAKGEIEVVTALGSYVFAEKTAELRSLFLYYETYGVRPGELVPGTTTELVEANLKKLDPNMPILRRDRPILRPLTQFSFSFPAKAYVAKRAYGEQTVFPFAITGQGMESAFSLSRWEKTGPDTLVLEFAGHVGPFSVTKRFTLHSDPYYTIDLELVIENPTGQEAASPLRMDLGSYTAKSKGPSLVFQFDGKARDSVLAEDSYDSFEGLGLLSKDIVFFLQTRNAPGVAPFAEKRPAGDREFGITLTPTKGKATYSFSLYGGRRRFLLMNHVGLGTLDAPGAGARMMVPVIQFLEILYRFTGNFGWAIILFTLVTRIILYPLMRKQFHSTAKMQKLAPKMKKLQERFKDDRQLQQQKLVELYRKEGVNPMSGCLPLLLQLPILILLWKAILYSAEEIHLAPGFLWISDLSLRDPYFIFVILTTLAMMVQQKMMTPMTTGDSGSAKYMGYVFPILMAFFLWNFPAGLWLYYFLTTIFQVGQQYVVNLELARAEAPTAAAGGGPEADNEDQGGGSGDGERQSGD